MKMNLSFIKSGIAFLLSAFAFRPSNNLGIASLPIAPTAGAPAVAAAPTVAVAGAIKPSETPGSIIALLNAQLDSSDPDVKFIVLGTVGSPLCRVIMAPSGTAIGTLLATETLIGTIEPDEATGDSVPSTAEAEGAYGDRLVEVLEVVNGESKARRSVPSLVNAVVDALRDPEGSFVGIGQSNFAIVLDQSAESFEIYQGATAGDLATELADVSTEAAPASTATRSVLRGS